MQLSINTTKDKIDPKDFMFNQETMKTVSDDNFQCLQKKLICKL